MSDNPTPTLDDDLRRARQLRDELREIEARGRDRVESGRVETDDDFAAKADAQARCDAVAIAWGTKAPPPMPGESVLAYRCRLMAPYQKHSEKFAKVGSLPLLARAGIDLDHVEGAVYADALVASRSPTDLGPGQLREVVRTDESGRKVSEFYGSWRTAFGPFLAQPRAVTAIGTPEQRAAAAIERFGQQIGRQH